MTDTHLRPLDTPRPVRVRTGSTGIPESLRVGRKERRVETVREVWRIDDEWWRRTVSRRYVAVVLVDGRPVTVYEDLVEGGWYLHG